MFRQIQLLAAVCALSGCAATGHSYSEHLKAQSSVNSNTAHATVYRTGDTDQYSARDARISLDEKTVSKVAYKGFSTFEISPGAHTLTVDMWDATGTCKLKIDVNSGTDYYFEVTPRKEHLAGALIFGVIGAAIESAGKECGGAFAIIAKPKEVATAALTPLKLTE